MASPTAIRLITNRQIYSWWRGSVGGGRNVTAGGGGKAATCGSHRIREEEQRV